MEIGTLIGIGIAIFSGIVGFLLRQEFRITKLETLIKAHADDPNLHAAKIEKLEGKIDVLEERISTIREMLVEMKSILDNKHS